jgi:hypothetical protein
MSRAITVGSRCRGRRRIARRGAEREGNDGKDEEKAQGEAQVSTANLPYGNCLWRLAAQ